jgi:hypothetical protein
VTVLVVLLLLVASGALADETAAAPTTTTTTTTTTTAAALTELAPLNLGSGGAPCFNDTVCFGDVGEPHGLCDVMAVPPSCVCYECVCAPPRIGTTTHTDATQTVCRRIVRILAQVEAHDVYLVVSAGS